MPREHGSLPVRQPSPIPSCPREPPAWLDVPLDPLSGSLRFSDADHLDRPWDDPAFAFHASPGPGLSDAHPGGKSATCRPSRPQRPTSGSRGWASMPRSPKGHARAGFFGDHRATSPVDVTDGLSDTMTVSEVIQPGRTVVRGRSEHGPGLDPAQQPYIGKGRQFRGTHAGGANVLMADGSVRYIKDTVDPKVFEAMSTIAGGEKVTGSLTDPCALEAFDEADFTDRRPRLATAHDPQADDPRPASASLLLAFFKSLCCRQLLILSSSRCTNQRRVAMRD